MEENKETLLFEEEAREHLTNGVNKVASAVAKTMGPAGKLVILAMPGKEEDIVTKDGVTVAEYMQLKHPIERLGQNLIQQTSTQTVEHEGDGTTTATVLAAAIVNSSGAKSATNLREFKNGIEHAKDKVLEALQTMCIKTIDPNILYKIAHTSANGDTEIATTVANLAVAVGPSGIIQIQAANNPFTKTSFEPGYNFNRGLPTTQFVNNPNTSRYEDKDCLVMLVNERIERFGAVQKWAALAKSTGKSLVIIAPDFSNEFIQTCAENVSRKLNNIVPLKTPEVGHRMQSSLEDVAAYVDGHIFSIADLEDQHTEKRAGSVEQISSGQHSTILLNTATEAQVKERVQHITNLLEEAHNEIDQKKLKERISQLTTGLANIYVGGITPSEIGERMARYEDAVGACLSAMKGGILPGGGMALYNIAHSLPVTTGSDNFKAGNLALLTAIQEPSKTILKNADLDEILLVQASEEGPEFGVDALTGEICNMFQRGIIDPCNVTISALETATSTAVLILSVGCIVDNN